MATPRRKGRGRGNRGGKRNDNEQPAVSALVERPASAKENVAHPKGAGPHTRAAKALEGLDAEKNALLRDKWLKEERAKQLEEENRQLLAQLEKSRMEVVRLGREASTLRSELEVANCSRDVASTVLLGLTSQALGATAKEAELQAAQFWQADEGVARMLEFCAQQGAQALPEDGAITQAVSEQTREATVQAVTSLLSSSALSHSVGVEPGDNEWELVVQDPELQQAVAAFQQQVEMTIQHEVQEQMAEARCRLRAQEEEAGSLRAALAERGVALSAAEASVADLKQELAAAHTRQKAGQEAARQQETRMAELQEALESARQRAARVADVEGGLAGLRGHMSELEVAADQSAAAAEAAEAEAARLASELTAADAALADAATRQAELEQQAEEMRAELRALRVALRERDEALAEADVRIAELEERRACVEADAFEAGSSEAMTRLAMEEAVAGLTARLAQRDDAIAGLEACQTDLLGSLADLRAKLKERDEAIAGMQQELVDNAHSVVDLTKERNRLQAELAQLEGARAKMDNFLESTWSKRWLGGGR